MIKPLFNAHLLAEARRASPRVLDDEQRRIVVSWAASAASGALLETQDQARELLNWLRLEFGVDQPGQRLETFADLTADDFVAEIRKRRPKAAPRLNPRAITEVTGTHRCYADAARRRAARVPGLERRLSDLVNRAYRLSEDDIELLWRTAPRMPHDGL